MNTNLKEVKDMAITFLNLELSKTEFFPMIIQHPFFNTSFVYIDGDFIDISMRDNFEKAKKYIMKGLNECKNVYDVFGMLNKPYRLIFYKYVKDDLSDEDKTQLLFDIYTETEFPNQDVNVTPYELCDWFSEVDISAVISDSDKEFQDKLPKTITVYRGVSKGSVNGLSWTLSYDKAKWFANRLSSKAENTVYIGKINKEDIFCFTDCRNEKELILNFNKVYDIKAEKVKKNRE